MLTAGDPELAADSPDATRLPAAYLEALARTDGAIDPEAVRSRDPAEARARAEQRLGRLRLLLTALGDPHLAYPVIHVAGTSGKGSTCVLAASILHELGYRTGLHTSPYLQVATEKAQIDGRMIEPERFLALVNRVIAASERAGIAPVTYGEIWFSLAALAFVGAGVDLAVIEVGAGGRFDLTNVVEPRVAVITSVGFDHMETLGSTLAEIAWHKAGIIKPGAPVVTAIARGDAREAIERQAALADSPVLTVAEGISYDVRDAGDGYVEWWELGRPDVIYPAAMPGRFQAANAALALAAVRIATGRTELDPAAVRRGIERARLPGRFEVVQRNPAVILDGAHNPEKMGAFAAALRAWLDANPVERLTGVIGALEAKAVRDMLAPLLPLLDDVVFTRPVVLAKKAAQPEDLAALAADLGFHGNVGTEQEPDRALARAIAAAGPADGVVVTGSLYLVGNLRGRWYPDIEVLTAGTPWPG